MADRHPGKPGRERSVVAGVFYFHASSLSKGQKFHLFKEFQELEREPTESKARIHMHTIISQSGSLAPVNKSRGQQGQ
eukprot:229511-Pelagomonas_calceolata.AAC.1